jgi:hypothetical protein
MMDLAIDAPPVRNDPALPLDIDSYFVLLQKYRPGASTSVMRCELVLRTYVSSVPDASLL